MAGNLLTGRRLARRDFCTALATAAAGAALAAGIPAARARPAETAALPDVIGRIRRHIARKDDTLVDLARRYDLGFTEIVAANPGIDPWVPGEGTEIVLPTAHILPDAPREGLVLNLADQRLYYFPAGGAIESFPIGTGRQAWDTPLGRTRVVRKKRNPAWYVPKSIRAEQPELPAVVPPGPDNPLGLFALYLGWPGYLIHGTNNPWGVGRRVSHGCIRLYPEDIERLFPRVAITTPVTVVRQEVKIGRRNGQILLEIHPSPAQADELEATGKFTPAALPELAYRVVSAAGKDSDRIDWPAVRLAARERRGLPVPVLGPERAVSSRN